MRRGWLPILALQALILGGCCRPPVPPSPASIVSSWARLGMYLPPASDVAAIRAGLPASLGALRRGLSDEDEGTRTRSAYVAEELAADATGLAPDIVARLAEERIPIVRVYLASAIAAVGVGTPESLAALSRLFGREADEQVKTALAGALVRLDSPKGQPEAMAWLIDSLRAFPPSPASDLERSSLFWERRHGATRHFRHVPEAEAAVLPLLKALRDDPRTPTWVVEQQVSKAIAEMERRAGQSAERSPGRTGR
jgi:hypothetical protein